jgi:hypothetical protein
MTTRRGSDQQANAPMKHGCKPTWTNLPPGCRTLATSRIAAAQSGRSVCSSMHAVAGRDADRTGRQFASPAAAGRRPRSWRSWPSDSSTPMGVQPSPAMVAACAPPPRHRSRQRPSQGPRRSARRPVPGHVGQRVLDELLVPVGVCVIRGRRGYGGTFKPGPGAGRSPDRGRRSPTAQPISSPLPCPVT